MPVQQAPGTPPPGFSFITQSAPFTQYGNIGDYQSGVWLVALNGKGVIVDRAHLPTDNADYQYYWLGGTEKQANSRLFQAIGDLNLVTDTLPTSTAEAFKTGVENINYDSLQPFHIGDPNPNSPYAKATHGAAGAATTATKAAGAAVGQLANLTGLFGNLDLWKGIGLVIAGVLILFIAGREIVKL